jgi:hypothetical protein
MDDGFVSSTDVIVAEVVADVVVIDDVDVNSDDNNDDEDVGGGNNISFDSNIESVYLKNLTIGIPLHPTSWRELESYSALLPC